MTDRPTILSANLLDTEENQINPATEEGQNDIVTAIENISSGGPDNFSYNEIEEDKTVTVPEYQQMGVWGELDIPFGGLNIDGEVILIA